MNLPPRNKVARFRVKWVFGWALMLIGPLLLIGGYLLAFMFNPYYR